MRARALLGLMVWASMVVGAVRLLGHATQIGGGGVAVFAVVSVVSAVRRRRRLRVWKRSGMPLFPPGPRRVLLLETGLAGPDVS